MNDVVQYLIVRFRPFPETGEFANVGILLLARSRGLLRFKIVPRRFRRVTQFFNALDNDVFSTAVRILQEELERLSRMMEGPGGFSVVENFLSRGRDSVWIFSEPRTLVGRDDLDDVLDKLYDTYVGRNFVNVDYQEQLMVREIRHLLKRREIYGFAERVIEDELVPLKFPLVSELNGLRVIKPMSFSQKTTLGVIDHAATWHDRFRLLLSRNRLLRQNVLIPVSGPNMGSPALYEAYRIAREEIRDLDIQVIERDDMDGLLAFAREGSTRQPTPFYR